MTQPELFENVWQTYLKNECQYFFSRTKDVNQFLSKKAEARDIIVSITYMLQHAAAAYDIVKEFGSEIVEDDDAKLCFQSAQQIAFYINQPSDILRLWSFSDGGSIFFDMVAPITAINGRKPDEQAIFRWFDPVSGIFYHQGKEVNLQTLSKSIDGILAKLNELSADVSRKQ